MPVKLTVCPVSSDNGFQPCVIPSELCFGFQASQELHQAFCQPSNLSVLTTHPCQVAGV